MKGNIHTLHHPKIIGRVRGIGAIQKSDLAVGMYFNNDGPGSIPLYDSADGTGDPVMTILPGQLIGQITDFGDGPNGYVVGFTSDAISNNQTGTETAMNYLLGWTGLVVPALSANFSDLQNNINSSQISTQKSAIDTANANGLSLTASLVNALKNAESAAGSIVFWPFVIIAGVWLVGQEIGKR